MEVFLPLVVLIGFASLVGTVRSEGRRIAAAIDEASRHPKG